uniref:Transposase n=1 Tax=Panagrellus redivivus TaxID=6233 RepID=A0A7E4VU54_PANRE
MDMHGSKLNDKWRRTAVQCGGFVRDFEKRAYIFGTRRAINQPLEKTGMIKACKKLLSLLTNRPRHFMTSQFTAYVSVTWRKPPFTWSYCFDGAKAG